VYLPINECGNRRVLPANKLSLSKEAKAKRFDSMISLSGRTYESNTHLTRFVKAAKRRIQGFLRTNWPPVDCPGGLTEFDEGCRSYLAPSRSPGGRERPHRWPRRISRTRSGSLSQLHVLTSENARLTTHQAIHHSLGHGERTPHHSPSQSRHVPGVLQELFWATDERVCYDERGYPRGDSQNVDAQLAS
jgi:hypothetical protein